VASSLHQARLMHKRRFAASRRRRSIRAQHGITVIDGGCPLMFGPTADLGHKFMRFIYAGSVPKQV
jgi:hypothetical protein